MTQQLNERNTKRVLIASIIALFIVVAGIVIGTYNSSVQWVLRDELRTERFIACMEEGERSSIECREAAE